jgi:hypothetical protein
MEVKSMKFFGGVKALVALLGFGAALYTQEPAIQVIGLIVGVGTLSFEE